MNKRELIRAAAQVIAPRTSARPCVLHTYHRPEPPYTELHHVFPIGMGARTRRSGRETDRCPVGQQATKASHRGTSDASTDRTSETWPSKRGSASRGLREFNNFGTPRPKDVLTYLRSLEKVGVATFAERCAAEEIENLRGQVSYAIDGELELKREIERLRKQVDCLTNGNMEQGCGHDHP